MAFRRFKALWAKIKILWKKVDDRILHNVDIALFVTGALKKLLSSQEVVTLTLLTPTNIDDKVREKVVVALDKVIIGLQITKTCNEKATIEEKIQCWLDSLKDKDPMLKEALLVKAASVVARELSGQGMTESEINNYVQGIFSAGKIQDEQA